MPTSEAWQLHRVWMYKWTKVFTSFIRASEEPAGWLYSLWKCAKHWIDDCFLNSGQYRAGLAEGLNIKGTMPLKSKFSYWLLKNLGQNKFVTCGRFEIYAVCLLYAIANDKEKADKTSQWPCRLGWFPPTWFVRNRPQKFGRSRDWASAITCNSSNRLVSYRIFNAMAERQRTCALCQSKASTLFLLPKTEELREKWLQFIFGEIPQKYGTRLVLCSAHFREDDFVNFGEYSRGFASKLFLKPGVVPSRRLPTSPTAVSTFIYKVKSKFKSDM